MIYTASSASIRRTFQVKFRDCSLNGSKGKRTYRLDVKPLSARTDDFNRGNNETISTENLPWEELRGNWQISSNRLSSNTSPSAYPLATIRANTKKARIRIGQGSSNWGWGAAFWVVDQNNWFSVTTDQYTSSGSFSYYTCPNGGTLSGTTCLKTCTTPGYTEVFGGNCCYSPHQTNSCTPVYPSCTCYDTGGCPYDASNAPDCQNFQTGYFSGCSCHVFSNVVGYGGGPQDCPPGSHYYFFTCYANYNIIDYTVAPYTYNGNCSQVVYPDTDYACNYEATLATGSSTAHLHRLILRKSINGVITTIGNSPEINTSQNARPSYVNVLTSDNTVTISAPMDNGSGTLTMTYNASVSDTRGIKFGVIFGETSGGSAASNVDNFEYEPVVV